ncbi:MAG: class flavin-dependent oxidoreductase [Solirubrobacterales bacterium]|nr:class flavin-dependent oxidoreductase [Solirubrobacterales bacterium]
MTALSVLDLSPVPAGSTESQALHSTIDLARHVENLGYRRHWLAEHHGIPSVASSSPEVLIGHVAAATRWIRVGSGGIMLPNHSALRIAEAFKVLEALHPGRIDLGIGRAPGTDQLTALALRRSREALGADDFPEQVGELLAFGGAASFPPGHPFARIKAIPTNVQLPPVFLLGSSDYSAQLAAVSGLGFAFAAHINPGGATEALRTYRERFVPGGFGSDRPHAILTVSVVVGDDDEHGERLASSANLSMVMLRTGRPGPLPSVETAMAFKPNGEQAAILAQTQRSMISGGPERVRARLEEMLVASAADELMVTTNVHDHAERKASYARLAAAMGIAPLAKGLVASA